MKCFPSRDIVDIRIFDKVFDRPNPLIVYHNNKIPNQIKTEDIINYNIRFNLFDIKDKRYVLQNCGYSEISNYFYNINKLSISCRLETIADLPVPIYTEETSKFRDIWEQLWK